MMLDSCDLPLLKCNVRHKVGITLFINCNDDNTGSSYSVLAFLLVSKTCNQREVSILCLHPCNTTVIHEHCDTDCEARLNFVNWCLFWFMIMKWTPHLFCLAGYLCFASISAQTLRIRGTCVLGW